MVDPEELLEGNTVDVKHTIGDGYELVPATGTHGGLQPGGNFKIDFTIDHNPTTYKESVVEVDGNKGRTEVTDIADHYEREHLVGVTMTPSDAFSTGCWILSELLGEDADPDELRELILNEYSSKNIVD